MYGPPAQQYGGVPVMGAPPSGMAQYGAPNPAFGAAAYPPASQMPRPPPTHQPQPPNQPHLPPADPMLIASDPNAFAAMYKSHLSTLTFNSKPIITNLTVIAHEHVARMSAVVAKCLDDHIMHSHPTIRLPALYTLDSICKNVGHPYTQLWSERIVPIFLETYRIVDQPTKMRMEELLATWKAGGPGGRPLLGEHAQWTIEKALFGSQGMPVRASAGPSAAAVAPTVDPRAGYVQEAQPSQPTYTKTQAIQDIDRLLTVDGQALAENPTDQTLQERVDSLAQLRQVIMTADLSQDEMAQIHAQLNSLSAATQRSNPNAHAAAMAAPAPNLTASTTANAPPAALPAALSGALANLSSSLASAPKPQQPSQGGTAAPSSNNAAASLFASLMQAGLLPGSTAAPVAPAMVEKDQDEDYVNAILSLDIKTSGPDFQREPSASLELILHKHLPLQCRQCANRYPQGEKGQGRMDDHLDWHFTQNRRAKDSAARGQSRSWFDRLENFIRGGFDDTMPSSAQHKSGGEEGSSLLGGASGKNAAQDKALREKFEKTFVIAPTDPDLASKPCPICKEAFKSQWSEDEEEWIWLNAIKVDHSTEAIAGTESEKGDIYYHASCHYSAKNLVDSVAAGTIRSGTTPDGITRRTASVGAGIKRRSASRNLTPSTAATADQTSRKRKSQVAEENTTTLQEEKVDPDHQPPPTKKVA